MKKYLISLCIIIMTLLLLYNIYNKNYILKVDNKYITYDEYMLYVNKEKIKFENIGDPDIWKTRFDNKDAITIAKQNAMNSIIEIKIAVKEANKQNIKLSKKEKLETLKKAKALKIDVDKMMEHKIPLSIYKTYLLDNKLQAKLYNYVTKGLVIDEKEFDAYFNKYVQKNKYISNNYFVDYIFVSKDIGDKLALQKIQDIQRKVIKSTDFNTLKDEDVTICSEEISIQNKLKSYLMDVIHKLNIDDISSIIDGIDGYYIFKINDIKKIDENILKENIRDLYTQTKLNLIYNAQMKIWKKEVQVKYL